MFLFLVLCDFTLSNLKACNSKTIENFGTKTQLENQEMSDFDCLSVIDLRSNFHGTEFVAMTDTTFGGETINFGNQLP